MGDGQHIWAAAEWLMMVRNLFVREEGNRLHLGVGVRPAWLHDGREAHFGPTLTPAGKVSVRFKASPGGVQVSLQASWRGAAPTLEWRVPGCQWLVVVGSASGTSEHFLPQV